MSFISRVQLNLLEIFEIGRFFVTVGTEVTRVTASASELNLNAAHTEALLEGSSPRKITLRQRSQCMSQARLQIDQYPILHGMHLGNMYQCKEIHCYIQTETGAPKSARQTKTNRQSGRKHLCTPISCLQSPARFLLAWAVRVLEGEQRKQRRLIS